MFLDVDSIAIGEDFRNRIRANVASADAVLVFIGPQWNATGLSMPTTSFALNSMRPCDLKKLVVPVLLEGCPWRPPVSYRPS